MLCRVTASVGRTRSWLDIWSGSAIIRAEIVNFSVELIEAIDRAFGASGPVGR